MDERRYSEGEIAEIFERAAEAQKSSLPASQGGEGLTLAELQDVGREVGLPPELVARAARSLDRRSTTDGRRLLGLPIGVAHTIDLERHLTDDEWHRVVADLRETFDARGRLSEQGPFKQWTNGNLQALLEPTPTGQRIRLQTLKGSSMSMVTAGLTLLGIAGFLLAATLAPGGYIDATRGFVFLSGIGVGMIGLGAAQLPAWARLRRRQMEEIAQRLTLALAPASPTDPTERTPGAPRAPSSVLSASTRRAGSRTSS